MNSMKKRILASVGVAIGLVASLALGIFRGAYADTDYVTKGTVSALVSCYENGAFKTPVGTTSFTSSTRGSTSMFLEGNQTVYVPIGYSGDTVKTKCADLVGGMITSRGISIPSGADSATQVDTFLTSLGYTMASSETASNTGRCFSVTYEKVYDWLDATTPSTSETLTTQRVCADVVESDIIQVDKLRIESGDTSIIQFQDARVGSIKIDCQIGGLSSLGNCNDPSHDFVKGQTKWSDFVEGIKQDLVTHKSQGTDYHPILGYMVSYELKGLSDGEVETNDESAAVVNAEYTMSASSNAIARGTETLAGWATNAKPAFSDDEKFRLYQAYLNNYYKADTKCGLSDDQQTSVQGNGYSEINYCTTSGVQACYVKPMAHTNDSVGGVENGVFGSDCDFNCVEDFMKNYDNESACVSSSTDPEQPQDNSTGFNGNTATDSEIIDCNGFENIGATQWILCPTANNMQYTANALDKITENMVQIDADVYNNTTVEQVWSRIRDIANVLMVVLLLVIVFSQLTGYGIDNYGIKKMLPRLILMAILINLSFYICQLAIDLSNILGVGLRNMFGGVGNSIGGQGGLSYMGTMIGGVFTGLAASSGAVGGGVSAGVAIFSLGASVAVAAWVAVLVFLLLIVVAVAIFFLSLGIRKILVIVCIILAPLAFAAYILPNTQRLFKNWWSLFKACLIIFPICGALSGISYLLKSMSQGTQLGATASLVMMVLPYAGFFLIPMLVTSAISALGKIGGAITSMGQNLRTGAQNLGKAGMKVAENTGAYKDMQKEATRRQQEQRVNRIMSRLGSKDDLDERVRRAREKVRLNPNDQKAQRELRRAEYDQRRLYDAQQTLYKMEAEQTVAGTSQDTMAARAQSTQESLEFKNISDQFANASNSQILTALTSAENAYATDRNSNNATRLRAMQSVAVNRGLNTNVLSGLNRLSLDDNNENDQKVLNSVDYNALYKGLTRSELANELVSSRDAYITDRNNANTRRLQNIIQAADGREMDKELLDTLGGMNMQAATVGANGQMVATNDARVLDTMSGTKNKVVKQFGIQMGKTANAQQNMTMDQFADSTGPVKLSDALTGKGNEYLNDANDDIVEYVANHSITTNAANGQPAYNPVMSSEQLANITANTTNEKVLRQTRRIYSNMNTNDIKFTGKQLANYDIDTLRILQTRIAPGSQLQKEFVNATNQMISDPAIMSNLSKDKKDAFRAIRRGAGINDNYFDTQ